MQKTLKITTFCALQNGRSYCIVGCLDFALHRIIPLAAQARRVFQRQPGRLRLNSHLRCSAAAAGAMERLHSDQPAPPSLHHRIHPGNIKSIAASQSSPGGGAPGNTRSPEQPDRETATLHVAAVHAGNFSASGLKNFIDGRQRMACKPCGRLVFFLFPQLCVWGYASHR